MTRMSGLVAWHLQRETTRTGVIDRTVIQAGMTASAPLTTLVLEPHIGSVSWLRQYVCGELGGDLMMADSVASMERAVAARVPDILLIGPGVTIEHETAARRAVRADPGARSTEIVRFGHPPVGGAARDAGGLGRWLKGGRQEPNQTDDFLVIKRRITATVERVRAARERRQQEELAARFQASAAAAAAAAAARAAAVPTSPVGNPASGGPVRPNSTRFAPARRAAAQPVGGENEWGFYDPSQCGADALAAALDRVPTDPATCAAELSPADMLLKFGSKQQAPRPAAAPVANLPVRPAPTMESGRAATLAISAKSARGTPLPRVSQVLPDAAAASPSHDTVAQTPNPAGDGVARAKAARRSKPFPLALWAHLTDYCHAAQQGPATLLRYTEAFASVATLALGLQLVPQVATVAYGSGCRIHRIRVVNSATAETGSESSWAAIAVADIPK